MSKIKFKPVHDLIHKKKITVVGTRVYKAVHTCRRCNQQFLSYRDSRLEPCDFQKLRDKIHNHPFTPIRAQFAIQDNAFGTYTFFINVGGLSDQKWQYKAQKAVRGYMWDCIDYYRRDFERDWGEWCQVDAKIYVDFTERPVPVSVSGRKAPLSFAEESVPFD